MPDFVGTELEKRRDIVHALAVEKGWWDRARHPAELIELIHSEISEATEESRDGSPHVYQFQCGVSNKMVIPIGAKEWNPEGKPEGILVEYADVAIRVLDVLGHGGTGIADAWDESLSRVKVPAQGSSPLVFHAALRKYVDAALVGSAIYNNRLIDVLTCLSKWFRLNRLEAGLIEVVDFKHAYNVTRPVRHGNKLF